MLHKAFESFDFTQFDIYYIDLFCGAGGTTTGLEDASDEFGDKIAMGIACVNHDANAIASHAANHPHILHYTEDIIWLDLTDLKAVVKEIRSQNPNAKIILWASLECTNFSNAKGGAPRDADSRTLAEHLIETEIAPGEFAPRYIPELDPDCIWIENVREFKDWGPLDENGKPIKEKKGIDYKIWCDRVKSFGYLMEDTMINAADVGGYTTRNRLFIQFNKPGINIVWPQATHAKNPNKVGITQGLKKWLPVREILKLDQHGDSVFNRKTIKKKELSDKTFERLFWGAVKHIAGGYEFYKTARALYYGLRYIKANPYMAVANFDEQGRQYIVKYMSGSAAGHFKNANQSIDVPACTMTTQNRYFISTPQFITKYFSGQPQSKSASINDPAPVVKCVDNNYLATCQFIDNYYGNGFASGLNVPMPTLRTKCSKTLITPSWIQVKQFQPETHNHSVDGPAPTMVTSKQPHLITTHFIMNRQGAADTHTHKIDIPSPTLLARKDKELITATGFIYRPFGSLTTSSLDAPAGTLTTVPKINLITPEPWLMDTQFNNTGSGIDEPFKTLVAARKQFYLINPQWGVKGNKSVNEPCFTLIARMDKSPPHLVIAESGFVAIIVEETDSYWCKRLKEFMAIFNIADFKMRALFITEKLMIQGFPEDYKLVGTQTNKNKFIGNSVHTLVAKCMMEAFYVANFPKNRAKAA